MKNNRLANRMSVKRYVKMGKSDRIAIKDVNYDRAGHDRVVYVYLTPDERNIMRIWCEIDHTFDCWHTKFAWTLPDIQEKVQIRHAMLKAGGRSNEQ